MQSIEFEFHTNKSKNEKFLKLMFNLIKISFPQKKNYFFLSNCHRRILAFVFSHEKNNSKVKRGEERSKKKKRSAKSFESRNFSDKFYGILEIEILFIWRINVFVQFLRNNMLNNYVYFQNRIFLLLVALIPFYCR